MVKLFVCYDQSILHKEKVDERKKCAPLLKVNFLTCCSRLQKRKREMLARFLKFIFPVWYKEKLHHLNHIAHLFLLGMKYCV